MLLDRLGREIRLQREGKSLRVLADECGLSHEVLWRIEHGRTNPRLRTLFAISEALETDVSDLLLGQPIPGDGIFGDDTVRIPWFNESDLRKLDVQASELIERWLLLVFDDPDKLIRLREGLLSLLSLQHVQSAVAYHKAKRAASREETSLSHRDGQP